MTKNVVGKRKAILFVGIALFLDQLSKWLVRTGVWSFDWGFLRSTLTYNTGTLWSLFAGANSNIFFIIFSLLILSAVFAVYKKFPQYAIPFLLVIAGGIGNLLDRVIVGAVIDFFDLGWWPIFNFADAYLSWGVLWLLVLMIAEEVRELRKKFQKKE